ADTVNLSPAPCWRRLNALEEKGYIKSYAALLDHEKIGLTITAFAHVSLDDHHANTVKSFDKAMAKWPEVQECHATSGGYDYLLKITTADMQSYNHFMYEKLLKLKAIRSVNTSFSMMQKKVSTELPLNHLSDY
ncbi:MAG TPA: Lrp/AsnC family transcriptional regulator, partial [Oceanospirillales bacterium]|nr:Lrp/AsnC family transcriptional regulator [Oceanospirillales bacterium]